MSQLRLLNDDATGHAAAARLLAQGALVAIPTETVYGLAADAANGEAVAAIYAAKGRPSFNPLIAHVADLPMAEALANFTPAARRLAHLWWPGPMTLVLPRRDGAAVSSLVTAGLDTLALRMPAHPAARAILQRLGRAVAAPSANRSGRISPTRASHVAGDLGDRIAAVLDGGTCGIGVESTILAPGDGADVTILRPGSLTAEMLRAAGFIPQLPDPSGGITAPGMLASHYAPDAPVRLNARSARGGEVMLGFGAGVADLNLSPDGRLEEAAANLFDMLRRLDARGAPGIAVAPIPDHGLGVAINDRLRRAAAPRG
ncbi:L-threonylcarbamoyladenylate synthase [Pseudooceanicola aestuarii]|uniref:L-threonylcarbamoyladenylate synthase n=1 Tax=Pseudooceanicola aestuarii TaxID=2697319 RepID=UPI0013D6EC98|nr:L-threonylcarbamoyladenylate synthase [Pseudooceanicola aestuarii]